MPGAYDFPEYYDIAFSFRDIAAEVDLFEECFRRFSRIPVRSVLELACGNSPHMEELVKRGYRYNGLELNEAMLRYSRGKAARVGGAIGLYRGDMADFALETAVDFVYVLLGSLYVKDTAGLISHFDSVARVLNQGGLYLLDWCIQYDPPWELTGGESWEMERDGVRVNTTVSWQPINRVEQTFEETLILDVEDRGETLQLVETAVTRAIFPQEFLCITSREEAFEFVGWWNNWDLARPLEEARRINRPIALLLRV